MWNAGAGKGHHGSNEEMSYFRLSSQGWPHGGGGGQEEQAVGRAEQKRSPAEGTESGCRVKREALGDAVGEQAGWSHWALGRCLDIALRTVEAIRAFRLEADMT